MKMRKTDRMPGHKSRQFCMNCPQNRRKRAFTWSRLRICRRILFEVWIFPVCLRKRPAVLSIIMNKGNSRIFFRHWLKTASIISEYGCGMIPMTRRATAMAGAETIRLRLQRSAVGRHSTA